MSASSVMHSQLRKQPNMYRSPPVRSIPMNSSAEEMSGEVILVGPGNSRRYVHIKIYRTSLEHFAVVYPLSKMSRPLGVINLRHTEIEPISASADSKQTAGGFLIKQKVFDTTTCLTVLCDSSTDITAWCNALTNKISSTSSVIQQCSLPIVQEEED